MGVNAETIQIMLDAGMGGQEILTVAKGMERGPDAGVVFTLIDSLRETACPVEAIAIAVLEVATNIVRSERSYTRIARDRHSRKRDSNKARRGLSNQKWREIRLRILDRDEWQCQYCGSTSDLTCDHIVPLVRGGNNDDDNLTTACRSCNSSKGDKSLSEWSGPIG